MAADLETLATEKDVHRGHRDALAALFHARPFTVISWETLAAICGPNFMQRVSDCRTQLGMHEIENVKRYAMIDGRKKRITGDYCFRPAALGRDASTFTAEPQRLPLYDGPIAGWQR